MKRKKIEEKALNAALRPESWGGVVARLSALLVDRCATPRCVLVAMSVDTLVTLTVAVLAYALSSPLVGLIVILRICGTAAASAGVWQQRMMLARIGFVAVLVNSLLLVVAYRSVSNLMCSCSSARQCHVLSKFSLQSLYSVYAEDGYPLKLPTADGVWKEIPVAAEPAPPKRQKRKKHSASAMAKELTASLQPGGSRRERRNSQERRASQENVLNLIDLAEFEGSARKSDSDVDELVAQPEQLVKPPRMGYVEVGAGAEIRGAPSLGPAKVDVLKFFVRSDVRRGLPEYSNFRDPPGVGAAESVEGSNASAEMPSSSVTWEYFSKRNQGWKEYEEALQGELEEAFTGRGLEEHFYQKPETLEAYNIDFKTFVQEKADDRTRRWQVRRCVSKRTREATVGPIHGGIVKRCSRGNQDIVDPQVVPDPLQRRGSLNDANNIKKRMQKRERRVERWCNLKQKHAVCVPLGSPSSGPARLAFEYINCWEDPHGEHNVSLGQCKESVNQTFRAALEYCLVKPLCRAVTTIRESLEVTRPCSSKACVPCDAPASPGGPLVSLDGPDSSRKCCDDPGRGTTKPLTESLCFWFFQTPDELSDSGALAGVWEDDLTTAVGTDLAKVMEYARVEGAWYNLAPRELPAGVISPGRESGEDKVQLLPRSWFSRVIREKAHLLTTRLGYTSRTEGYNSTYRLLRSSEGKVGDCRCDRSKGDVGGRCTQTPGEDPRFWCYVNDHDDCSGFEVHDGLWEGVEAKWTYGLCESEEAKCVCRRNPKHPERECKVVDGRYAPSPDVHMIFKQECGLERDHRCPVYAADLAQRYSHGRRLPLEHLTDGHQKRSKPPLTPLKEDPPYASPKLQVDDESSFWPCPGFSNAQDQTMASAGSVCRGFSTWARVVFTIAALSAPFLLAAFGGLLRKKLVDDTAVPKLRRESGPGVGTVGGSTLQTRLTVSEADEAEQMWDVFSSTSEVSGSPETSPAATPDLRPVTGWSGRG